MRICLRQPRNLSRRGKIHRYEAGDWIDVGRHIAEKWIAEGVAFSTDDLLGDLTLDSAGLVVRDESAINHAQTSRVVQDLGLAAHITSDWSYLRYAESLVWFPSAKLRPELVAVGFELLKTWHIAIPLAPDGVLASNTGPESERAKTAARIGDGRIPLRDTRLIFVRRCGLIRELWSDWHAEMENGADEQHSFLRAVYKHKPLICDLPSSWVK